MSLYESVFITRQDISSSQAEALIDTFAEIVSSNGGAVAKKEYWGLRSLTYKINKNRKGHYALLNIDGPPIAISEMERNMRIHDDVLRYLTVRVDEHDEGPSAILKGRDERGGRGGRDDRPRDNKPRDYKPRDGEATPAASPEAVAEAAVKPAVEAAVKPAVEAAVKPAVEAAAKPAVEAAVKGDEE